ncbi:V-type ATP synthase subunit D [Arhodomonas aquaeolei]|uniref:V-type ATP synthase subunit D n=1 Tax=Arhodomonas aquaeolei TaxID=2369 RepID=UPI00037F5E4D|nr:V-type ATP synthase subunit D [Arhodomonas aquaeolei]MCS4505528.1 V-type ATP synthase subunit D [Arhodomonas aquaeolei]
MARTSLNKTALHHEQARLRRFQRILPSLDLKRRQLIAERSREQGVLAATERDLAALTNDVRGTLPMAGDERVVMDGLVRVTDVRMHEHNLLGVHLPVLDDVAVETSGYALLATPHWLDIYADRLAEALRLNVRLMVERERLRRLERAVTRVTQRVNLFDKVLIPRARENIRRIRIHIADNERAAVVRAKIAKRKHAGMGP